MGPRPRPRVRVVLAAVGLVAVTLALATTALAAAPVAQSTRTCSPPAYPGSGYFTSLTVRGVSCRTGRRVTLAHYRCRTRSGPRGRCRHRVLRYSCKERRNSIPTEIDARVTCRRPGRTVVYTYQQNV
jgi:hypothetical protein